MRYQFDMERNLEKSLLLIFLMYFEVISPVLDFIELQLLLLRRILSLGEGFYSKG